MRTSTCRSSVATLAMAMQAQVARSPARAWMIQQAYLQTEGMRG